jgi:hypothetical protein
MKIAVYVTGGSMGKILVFALAGFLASGCSSVSVVTKNFKVITDPPDSIIRVVSGTEQKEEKFSSPAIITAEVPKDPALAARAFLEVSKDKYKPTTITLRHLNDGDTIRVKLEKIIPYQLKYRLLAPTQSDELKFQDKAISISFTVNEQAFQMGLTNLTAYPLKIRWQSAEYTDVYGRQRRLMHSGVPFQERNNPIPDQTVLPGKSLQETVTPIENVSVSPQTGGYVVKPLFARDGEIITGLKGKTFNLFIPIEIDRQINPYNFKIEIIDVMKEAMK